MFEQYRNAPVDPISVLVTPPTIALAVAEEDARPGGWGELLAGSERRSHSHIARESRVRECSHAHTHTYTYTVVASKHTLLSVLNDKQHLTRNQIH